VMNLTPADDSMELDVNQRVADGPSGPEVVRGSQMVPLSRI
jgi:hypothetical protein